MVNYIGERVSYSEKNGELIIVISGKVEKWQETLLTVWMIAWTFCGIYVLAQLFGEYSREEKLMFVVYTSFWAYFEYKIVYAFFWRKWGSELIRVGGGSIQIKKDIKKYGKVNSYFIENLKNLKQEYLKDRSFAKVMANSFWNMTEKAISFEYFGKLIAFGIQLSDEDAKKVLKLISAHLRKKA